jgi:hypothetical protein
VTVFAAGALLAAACSSNGGESASTTAPPNPTDDTAVADPSDGSLSPTPPPADEEPVGPPTTTLEPDGAIAGLQLAVYWSRPFGQARPLDVPGYQDPDGGPYPFVMFGAVTNVSDRDLSPPRVVIGWHDGDGQVRVTAAGRVLAPDGRDLDVLSPGATADLLVVVHDPTEGEALADLIAVIVEGSP